MGESLLKVRGMLDELVTCPKSNVGFARLTTIPATAAEAAAASTNLLRVRVTIGVSLLWQFEYPNLLGVVALF